MNNEALRLAELCKRLLDIEPKTLDGNEFLTQTAAELRRLHEVNQELVEALKALTSMAEYFPSELHKDHPDVITAKAALAKATGESK